MSRETSDSPESCRTGSSSGRLLQVVLASATPSVSSPSRPLPQKELEELNAPGWENNLQEAIVWFYRLRAAVKSIVYRFINNMKAAMALFERHHVEYYAGHSRLEEAIPKIWRCWNQFISTNSMTEDCLRQLNFLADLRENIQNMTMTPYRVPRTSRDEMGNIRDNARFIAVEGYSVFDMAIEALTLLEEKQVGHEIDELFPTIPEYADAPNLEAPAGAEEDTEEEILRSGGIRDPEKLDRTRFAPVWIRHYGFPDSASDELLEELREIVGTGSGSYSPHKNLFHNKYLVLIRLCYY